MPKINIDWKLLGGVGAFCLFACQAPSQAPDYVYVGGTIGLPAFVKGKLGRSMQTNLNKVIVSDRVVERLREKHKLTLSDLSFDGKGVAVSLSTLGIGCSFAKKSLKEAQREAFLADYELFCIAYVCGFSETYCLKLATEQREVGKDLKVRAIQKIAPYVLTEALKLDTTQSVDGRWFYILQEGKAMTEFIVMKSNSGELFAYENEPEQ